MIFAWIQTWTTVRVPTVNSRLRFFVDLVLFLGLVVANLNPILLKERDEGK